MYPMAILGSAAACWLMPWTPDPEVAGSSPTRVKPCCVLEQGTFTPPKVLVIPRKRYPNMTEKLFTGTLRINQPTNLRLFTYPYNLRNSFQRDPVFQFSNWVNISTAMTSLKELLLRNPTKTSTFDGHAKSSSIKNAKSWNDTDTCCVADVGVS